MFIRNPYNYDLAEATKSTGLSCKDEHLTVQDQAEDVNDLVRSFGITGKMPTNVRIPQYGDFTGVGTYQEALEAVKRAENEFLKLPANIRLRFQHNPQAFLEFVSDEKNAQEGEKLGIWKLKKAQEAATAKPEAAEGAKKDSPATT